MDWLQVPVAVNTAKLATWAIKTSGRGSATSLPGKLALKLAPDILSALARQIQHRRVTVTGTNGKSTTAGLLASVCKASGYNTVHNALGANMKPGITASLIQETNLLGQFRAEMGVGVFEVDEASLPGCALDLKQHWTLVTNLFRDQLDRYGELDTTARLIETGIRNSGGGVMLNADDPMVTAIGWRLAQSQKVPVAYYGVRSLNYPNVPPLNSPVNFPKEVTDCPLCQAPLQYTQFWYGHLGHYHCSSCEFKRPEPQYEGDVQLSPDHSIVSLDWEGHHTVFPIELPGLYNAYNMLAALSMGLELGLQVSAIKVGLDRYRGLFGRAEHQMVAGKPTTILLIKNPIGAWEVLKVIAGIPNARILIAINDQYADGRDISWLWDAPFEYLQHHPNPIMVSGHRADDMALRLLYGGVSKDRIVVEPKLMRAVEKSTAAVGPQEQLFILPTYTALLELSLALGSR